MTGARAVLDACVLVPLHNAQVADKRANPPITTEDFLCAFAGVPRFVEEMRELFDSIS